LHTVINIIGLSTGITCFILITTFVYYEWNYDDFHRENERIFQICRLSLNPDGSSEIAATTPMPLTGTLRNEYEHYGTTIGIYQILTEEASVMVDGEEHFGLKGVAVEQEFFQEFNFNDVVISERAAERYFGNRDPIGKIFLIRNIEFIVRGLVKNPPNNTVFKFDVFFSSKLRPSIFTQLEDGWWSSGPYNFMKLKNGVTKDDLKSAFIEIKDKYFPEFLIDRMGFDMQPIRDVHLNTEVAQQIYPTIDEIYLVILMIVAISVLLIACINYINLSTSIAGQRAKETGIKKVVGASRIQLMTQFYSESIILSLFTVFISLILSELFLPWFNVLTYRNIELNFYSYQFLITAGVFGILIGLFSGIYPGLVLSSFRPVSALKPDPKSGMNIISGIKGKSHFRRTLVIFQLTVTIILVSTEILILKQIHFMQTADLGYNLENILSIPLWSVRGNQEMRYEMAKRYLEQVEPYKNQFGFSEGTISENIPGFFIQNRFRVTNPDTREEMEIISIAIDESFINIFEIDLIKGQDFSHKEAQSQPEKILINQTAMKEMNWDQAIGKSYELWPNYYTHIIGILPDLHVESLQKPVGPLMFRFGEKNNFPQFISFKLNQDKMNESILFFQNQWKEIMSDTPFMYYFPKDKYLEHYAEERRIAKILATFVILTILISGLGIFGLVLFNTHIRQKEIGIRKTFGATVMSIFSMLSKELSIWILIAFCIAVIPSWYAMHGWLDNFAYRTSISWWVFGLAVGIMILISLITGGWNTYKAARKNPVEVLKYE
jgi:putative ABC transport system permease protein